MDLLDRVIDFFKGKDTIPIWQQFANENQGELKSNGGDIFVEYQYLDFKFRIGEFTHYVSAGGSSKETKYMIGMLIFVNPSNFELSLTPVDLFDKIGKKFKNKDIIVGNKNFDNKFYVKSNYEFKAISILKNKALLEKIITPNPTLLEVTKEKGLFEEHRPPEGKYMFYFAKQEKFKDIQQLNFIRLLQVAFIESLKENCEIHQ